MISYPLNSQTKLRFSLKEFHKRAISTHYQINSAKKRNETNLGKKKVRCKNLQAKNLSQPILKRLASKVFFPFFFLKFLL
jgi:hypothetical protein